MAAPDLSSIVTLTVQLNSLQAQAAKATDPTVKAFLQSQIEMATAQLAGEAQHQQSQLDASSNLLSTLGLFGTLQTTVGTLAPSIIALFK